MPFVMEFDQPGKRATQEQIARDCGQEMCHNWAGGGCICEALEIEPDIEPET